MLEYKSSVDRSSRAQRKSAEGRRILFERSLRPSAATLIVVPLALLEHWYEQIVRHVGLQYFALLSGDDRFYTDDPEERCRGVVYLDGLGDIADIQAPLSKCQVTSAMAASPETLAHYLIVITTLERCHQQYSLTVVLSEDTKNDFAASSLRDRNAELLESKCYSSTTLLQVRWLRLVVDEGHELGAGAMPSNAALFISEVAAERRWVMSGTPTSALSSRSALAQMQRLLQFLREETYGVGLAGLERWKAQVQDAFAAHRLQGAAELERVLRRIMVRHMKVS
jgi:SNF2 family DNA or RNA helicase